jgi:hypothetical protein
MVAEDTDVFVDVRLLIGEGKLGTYIVSVLREEPRGACL